MITCLPETEHLSPTETEALRIFMDEHRDMMSNPVLQGFFKVPSHLSLLAKCLIEPESIYVALLGEAFKRYFFNIRFTKYLSSLIRFSDIDYHRRRIREEGRSLLVFDTPLGENSFGEVNYRTTTAIEDELPIVDPHSLEQAIHNDRLYFALQHLTYKQKLILTLTYSACALDKEIASVLCISQQAISKTRRSALQKLRGLYENPLPVRKTQKQGRRREQLYG